MPPSKAEGTCPTQLPTTFPGLNPAYADLTHRDAQGYWLRMVAHQEEQHPPNVGSPLWSRNGHGFPLIEGSQPYLWFTLTGFNWTLCFHDFKENRFLPGEPFTERIRVPGIRQVPLGQDGDIEALRLTIHAVFGVPLP